MNIGEPEIPTGVAVGQLFMIQSHQVQDRGVKVVDMDGVLFNVVSNIIGLTVNRSCFDSSSGQPAGKSGGMVIAAA